MWNVIRRQPNKRAPCPDKILNCAIKYGGKKFITFLCQIYYSCARLEYFPKEWKEALIIMIPIPGKDLKIPTNHRHDITFKHNGEGTRKVNTESFKNIHHAKKTERKSLDLDLNIA